jgi:hypothetical protein
MDNDTQKENKEKASPNQPARGVFDVLVVQFGEHRVSKLQETFGDSRGIVVVHQLKEVIDRLVVKVLCRDFVRVLPVGEVESRAVLVFGSFEEKCAVLQDLHQVPFHIGLARPVPHSGPNIQHRNKEMLAGRLGLRNQSGQRSRPNLGPPLVLGAVRSRRVGEARMDKNGQRVVTLERHEPLNINVGAMPRRRTCVRPCGRPAMEWKNRLHRLQTFMKTEK